MATTGARRTSSRDTPATRQGSPTSVRLGVQWGYPFSLVRRLFLGFICLLTVFFVGAYIVSQPTEPVEILIHLVPAAFAILLSMYVVEIVGVTERPLPPLNVETLFWSIATSCIVMSLGYALLPTYAPSTTLACSAPVVATLGAFLVRKWKEAKGGDDQILPAALFVHDRTDAVKSLARLADAPGIRVRVLIMPDAVEDRSPVAGLVATSPRQAVSRVREEGIQLFVVGQLPDEELRPILAPCAGVGCVVERADDLVAMIQGRVNLTHGADIDLLNRLTKRAQLLSAQRTIDLLLTLAATPIAIAIGLPVALLVKATSKGPVFFRQKRVGLWGREFTMVKFRTMRSDAEKETGPVWAQDADPRITTLGRFLRNTRLDEIPQLWNVLRGDMSLVGPRPERRYFVESLSKEIPLYDARHSVRPGLTGWAQIRYAYGATVDDARMKLGYELFYILNRSMTFYFAVVLETVKVLLFRRGAR